MSKEMTTNKLKGDGVCISLPFVDVTMNMKAAAVIKTARRINSTNFVWAKKGAESGNV